MVLTGFAANLSLKNSLTDGMLKTPVEKKIIRHSIPLSKFHNVSLMMYMCIIANVIKR